MTKQGKLRELVIKSLLTRRLTIRFLVLCTSARTAKLLGLAFTRIGYQESSVVADQELFEIVFALLVNKFAVESNDSLSQCLTDSIDLGNTTTTAHFDLDIEPCKTSSLRLAYNSALKCSVTCKEELRPTSDDALPAQIESLSIVSF
ncbi:Dkf-2p [Cichlidogyrus casuarinus]|uniref:Dkf-2p n=1 Tax=Cichlidogyrus casuarinus TaxID=1844966 RepID=A0ABD2PMI3_9PLAT